MDDFDHASDIEEQYRALAIAAATRPARGTAESEVFCQNEACGEPIPDERRRAISGCRFCIECQERREHALKRRYPCK
ncbi:MULTISPECIES: TraR/DksA C4-type zinc finger protein [Burkholderia]|uniref:TraR/DksA C4-type zinc finger protein n=1 Tax=Burkholderia TaxID=32008 RepID=UPI0005312199|nr:MULTISPECIES: TraR/DksA C4-type zinc finger protein [Burkholderia]AOJ69240.1 conjugal transfer protein TraR [Burkholderia savannae]KGS01502.1 prokaryotic dksA/traR C4-type zinc finger family protein [Burkholderia sp. ABCPW 111]KVG48987.1 conjugal transfer protein TraR [Burkholderia sp. MSMB0265]KVG78737.1 conjugal transfer protein TraR [Burkholderia sp. MSMB2040]